MYSFAICDDDALFVDNLAELLEQTLGEENIPFSLDTYTDTASLFDAIERGGSEYHALMLDIIMENESGISLATRLRKAGIGSSIIFITSSPDFALESFEVDPVHYLLKPVSRQSLRVAVRRCVTTWRRSSGLILTCKDKSSHIVRLEDILYAEIFLTELEVHLKDGGVVTGTGKMKEMLEQLPGTRFYQCHRSFVVNLEEVAGICRFAFTLKGGRQVPIAQRKYGDAIRALSLYNG